MRMHADEVDISADLVRGLVAGQFPLLSGHPVAEFESTGTVNAIYRLGSELYVRLPRVERWWAPGLQKELKWLPVLAPGLTLQVPEPVGVGRPTSRVSVHMGHLPVDEGQAYEPGRVDDEGQMAADLAGFIAELRNTGLPTIDDQDAFQADGLPSPNKMRQPGAGSRAPGDLDANAGGDRGVGRRAGTGRPGTAPAAGIHGDLAPPNLLVREGRLRAVLDFGRRPASVTPRQTSIRRGASSASDSRPVFRDLVGADDDTWRRSRGIAISQAVGLVPYYAVAEPQR